MSSEKANHAKEFRVLAGVFLELQLPIAEVLVLLGALGANGLVLAETALVIRVIAEEVHSRQVECALAVRALGMLEDLCSTMKTSEWPTTTMRGEVPRAHILDLFNVARSLGLQLLDLLGDLSNFLLFAQDELGQILFDEVEVGRLGLR